MQETHPEPRRTFLRDAQAANEQRYRTMVRMAALEAALADCVRYISSTYDNGEQVVSFSGVVAPKPEPSCSVRAKQLLGWVLG